MVSVFVLFGLLICLIAFYRHMYHHLGWLTVCYRYNVKFSLDTIFYLGSIGLIFDIIPLDK